MIPFAIAAYIGGMAAVQAKTPATVSDFDLTRYLGKWYEIARFDHRFERGLENVTAEYILKDNGMVDVINSGWKGSKFKIAEGKARQKDPISDPVQLEVSFFLWFYSDYNIMMLDDDYQVALVGSSSPDYLWILSRTPSLGKEVIEMILSEASERGYDTSKLIWVDQSFNISQNRLPL